MAYLVYNDYAVTIQDFAFKQWIAQNDALRVQAEPRAQAKIKEYLVQKYDLTTEFADTNIYKDATTYKANALVQLNYTAWASGSYTAGQFVSYSDGNVYRCILNTTANQAPTDATYWILVGVQLQLTSLVYPYPVFDLKGIYALGDRVWWNGKIYQNISATVQNNHATELQDYQYANVPPINYFPDDKVNGPQQWGTGVSYSVVGIYPRFVATNGTWSGITNYTTGNTVNYNGVMWQALKPSLAKIPGDDITNWQSITWTVGDNRNQSILDAYVAITLYYLSFRIAPKALPIWVKDKYDAAMAWLQSCAEGLVTLDVPVIQPTQGARIRFNSLIKQVNSY